MGEARAMREKVLSRRGLGSVMLGATLVWLLPRGAFADKAGAAIEGPPSAKRSEEITLRVTFTHSANSSSHFIQWARVVVNEKEVARWDFSPGQLPEGATFAREIKLRAESDMRVTAQANCNKHGSKGPATMNIKVS